MEVYQSIGVYVTPPKQNGQDRRGQSSLKVRNLIHKYCFQFLNCVLIPWLFHWTCQSLKWNDIVSAMGRRRCTLWYLGGGAVNQSQRASGFGFPWTRVLTPYRCRLLFSFVDFGCPALHTERSIQVISVLRCWHFHSAVKICGSRVLLQQTWKHDKWLFF